MPLNLVHVRHILQHPNLLLAEVGELLDDCRVDEVVLKWLSSVLIDILLLEVLVFKVDLDLATSDLLHPACWNLDFRPGHFDARGSHSFWVVSQLFPSTGVVWIHSRTVCGLGLERVAHDCCHSTAF